MAGADNLYMGIATVYVAPVGTAFPAVDDAEAAFDAAWFRIGTDGAKSYAEDGVTVRRNVTSEDVRTLGTTLIRKTAITEAGFEVEFNVLDMDPAQVMLAWGGDETDVTDVVPGAGVPGTSTIVVPTSPTPVRRAVLVRYPMSPEGVEFNTDVHIQDATQVGGGEATIAKGGAMQWQHLWKVLEPASGNAIEVVYQTAAAA